MTDYWKSTPKYWCKHCKVFVRDTKLEKQNHDATPRHQGNIKRFLRDLQRGHDKDEKDKERARSEVARLNGLVSGTSSGGSSGSSGFGSGPTPSIPKSQATPFQRKQQVAQLAELGISIPDEFRGDMAMPGEWQVTSERIIEPTEGEDKKPDAIGIGVRKRVVEDDDEEAEAMKTKKRNWGSTYRTHPVDDDVDLDSLLSKPLATREKAVLKEEPLDGLTYELKPISKLEAVEDEEDKPVIKREPSYGEVKLANVPSTLPDIDIKQEEDSSTGGIIFKKRKAKNIRHK